MKIILAGPAWPYRGGIAEFSNRLMQQFSAEGHQAEIVTFRLQYPSILFPGKSQLTGASSPGNIQTIRLINSINPLNWLKTGNYIRKLKPDILILRFWLPFMGPCLGTIARLVRRNKQTKIVCVFDNVIPHEKRPGDKLFTKYFTGSIDCAIVMAESVGKDLEKFRKDLPVRLLYHPLYDNYGNAVPRDEALSKLKLDVQFRYILFFGFVRKYKGLDLLLHAFSDDRFRNSGIRLIVAGEFYEDEKYYTGIIDGKKIHDEVIFFNRFIPDDEVKLFFSAADIVAQPYRSATQSGVSQIAFNFDRPVLVTDVGGLREIVPDRKCGYVVNPDPQEIAGSLIDFFSNDRVKSFSECVREQKKKFGWEKFTEAILECCTLVKPR
ncbi:MAG TPA: glycosyltransferase [Bacteroidales bacterium]|nr:glycosyltransferase [Bacteroidales bacterium]